MTGVDKAPSLAAVSSQQEQKKTVLFMDKRAGSPLQNKIVESKVLI